MKKIILNLLVTSLIVPSMFVFGGCNKQYTSIKDATQMVENLGKDLTEIKMKLTNDISISDEVSSLFASTDENKQNVVIDLGGKTLSYSSNVNFNIADGSTLTFKNGKLRFDTNGNVNTGNITVYDNSKLILDDVEYYATGNNVVALGEANVEIKNSKLSSINTPLLTISFFKVFRQSFSSNLISIIKLHIFKNNSLIEFRSSLIKLFFILRLILKSFINF